jgi:aminopeptidase N
VSGEDLNWFWQKWFFERGYPDLAVKDVKSGGGKVRILVEKIGNYPVPVELKIETPDGRTETIKETAAIWKDGINEKWIEADYNFDPLLVELGATWIPDSDQSNNKWQQK